MGRVLVVLALTILGITPNAALAKSDDRMPVFLT
jgi:putative SOS response-associated peptidase YedK